MAKEYRKKILALTAAFVLAGSTPLADVFTFSAQASDGEEDSSSDEDKDEDGGSDQSSGKDESAKKAEEKKKESEKKAAEIKRESAKRAIEVRMESEKRKAEILKKSRERKSEGLDAMNASRQENEDDDENDDDASENEDDSSGKEFRNKGAERRLHAAEKIAEVEKYILEKQSEGKDMTVALERLAQAKSMLSAAGETQDSQDDSEDSQDGSETEDLVKESLKLAHTAKENDAHDINDVYKYIKKASERIGQATKKLSRLAAAGGETASYQSMIDAAASDLDSARNLLSQGSLLESSVAARKAEDEAKSAKRAIESAGLALGLHDDELSGEHKSTVSKAVEDLLYVADTEGDNAIGTKIREIARQQRDSADKVDTFIDDAQSRSEFSEFVLGPKYRDLKGISEQISANNDRIRSLEESANQLSDEDLKQVVQEHIDALNEENNKLQGFVDGKEKQRGIFGWVFRLMQQ